MALYRIPPGYPRSPERKCLFRMGGVLQTADFGNACSVLDSGRGGKLKPRGDRVRGIVFHWETRQNMKKGVPTAARRRYGSR